MTNLIGQPCEMLCEYELELVVRGAIENPPACEFVLNIRPAPGPGICMSDCPTEGFTIPVYGITDQTLGKVIFHQEEIGFRTIDIERATNMEQSACEASGGQWIVKPSQAPFCQCPD